MDGVKLHALYILSGTPLAQLYAEGKYQPLTMEEYAAIACDFLKNLPPGIIIHRLCSDPPNGFVAPQWLRNKSEVIRRIEVGADVSVRPLKGFNPRLDVDYQFGG